MKLLAPPSHYPPSSSPPAQNEFNGKTPNALSYLHINAPISFVWSLDTWLNSIVMNRINFGWYPPLFFIHLPVKLAQIHFGISRFEIIPGSPLLCHQLSTHHLFSIKQTYLLLGWYKIVVLRVIADANDFKEPPPPPKFSSGFWVVHSTTPDRSWRGMERFQPLMMVMAMQWLRRFLRVITHSTPSRRAQKNISKATAGRSVQ